MAVVSILLWMVASTAAQAQNLASNPGFETGDTSGWTGFGATIGAESSVVHSGHYAAVVTGRTQNWTGIAQEFEGVMEPWETYTISAWFELDGSTNQTISLVVQQKDGAGTTYPWSVSATVTTNGWTQMGGYFTVLPTGTLSSLLLYAEVPTSATASFYIDDLSVIETNTPALGWPCTVEWGSVYQRIDGFGASSANDGNWTTNQADLFFSTNAGAGLSLLRSRIAPDGTSEETSIMQWAQERGARVWSTPWTPPPQFKDNNSLEGGHFLSQFNQPYAAQLANYVLNMKTNYGVNIYAISLQNEPQAPTEYESCQWTAQQFHDFIPCLYNALASNGVGNTKILFAESASWGQSESYTATAMSDPAVSNLVGIIAAHDYDYICTPLDNGSNPLWETEVSTFDPYDGSIANGLYWAGQIYDFLTIANVNAWHYWSLTPGFSDNESLVDAYGNPAKRLYTLGNYSRFVRPGYYRVGVSTESWGLITAFRDSVSGHFAIVAVNSAAIDMPVAFDIAGLNPRTVTPCVTSAAMSLSNQAPVSVSNSVFSYDLPAMSVVTFAGLDASASPGLSVSIGGNGPMLTLNGPAGMQYTLLSSTNLSTWQTVLTTNPPAMPIVWTDTNTAACARYYTVQYGP